VLALPASTPNAADYVVLIRRGTYSFVTTFANAAAFGVQHFLINKCAIFLLYRGSPLTQSQHCRGPDRHHRR
jgi:hypothetical protein